MHIHPKRSIPAYLSSTVRHVWWHESDVLRNAPEVQYAAIMQSDEGVKEWTRKIVSLVDRFTSGPLNISWTSACTASAL